MAESRSLVPHIETYVSSSSSTAQQNASLDEIAALVKKGTLTVEAFVRELELYLTTTDNVLRLRGVTLLAEVLKQLLTTKLNEATLHSLAEFFSAKLADWQVVQGALLGCLSLLRRRQIVGIVQGSYAIDITQSFLQNLQVQLLAQHDRMLCFELLQCMLDFYPEDVASLGEDLIYGICEAIDDEKDPHCLLLTFRIVESLGRLFTDPSGPVASFAEELFEILGRYFPIYFTHPLRNDLEIRRDDLANALMLALSSTSFFEPFAIPLLLEKLSSSLLLAKIDSLEYLRNCILHYGAEKMVKHSKSIWYSLKEVILTFSGQESLSVIQECIQDKESQKSKIFREATNCLQMAISKLNTPNHSFMGWILEDEEFDLSFSSSASEVNYKNLPEENKRKLHAVGSVLNVSAKISHEYCDMVFRKFFPRLMGILGVSSCKSVSDSMGTECMVRRELSFGAVYLSVGLLSSCLDMVLHCEDFRRGPEANGDTWPCLLQDFHKSLANSFMVVVTNYNTETGLENVHYAVKALQTLTMFPRCFLQISDAIYEDIIKIFMAVLLEKSGDSSLGKFILKALVEIGSSLEKFPDSIKERSYTSCALERMMSELHGDESDIWFSLKLEAVFAIGTSRPKLMPRVVKKLERLTFLRLLESMNDVRSKSTGNLVHLLDYYSTQVLPWCSVTGYFEESVMHFAVEIWNRMEGLSALQSSLGLEHGIIDGMMMAVKTAVGICKVQDQIQILEKAYKIIQFNVFPSLDYSAPFRSFKLDFMHVYSGSCEFTGGQKILLSIFVSVLIALHPQTALPNVEIILKWLLIFFLKGHCIAAQALGSIVNKWPREVHKSMPGSCSLQEALDYILCEGAIKESAGVLLHEQNNVDHKEINLDDLGVLGDAILTNWVSGLAWIGKGLLMCGHERVKDVTVLLLKYLLSSNHGQAELPPIETSLNSNGHGDCLLARFSADAFEVLLSDSDMALNKKFHAMIKPLYKQKFFSSIAPILLSCISEANLNTRTSLYRAFAHVICNTPQAVILPEAEKLILPLLEGLSLLSVDSVNKDLVYNLLLLFSGFLMDETGKEAIVENVHKVISSLLGLASYPHMMLVREAAIQCLVAFSDLPYARIYPMRQQILQIMSKALDDPKRPVRLEAIKCLHTWTSLA